MKKKSVKLESLEDGFYGLSKKKSAAHAEASFYCLDSQSHASGVEMQVSGSFECIYFIEWQYLMTEQILRTWRENNEATDEGACGLALLLVTSLTDYTDVSRAWHTSGFDYYLGFAGSSEPFDKAAKLEVSGIRAAKSESEIRRRVHEKLTQTDVSDGDELPVYVAVIEFSKPLAQVVKK